MAHVLQSDMRVDLPWLCGYPAGAAAKLKIAANLNSAVFGYLFLLNSYYIIK